LEFLEDPFRKSITFENTMERRSINYDKNRAQQS